MTVPKRFGVLRLVGTLMKVLAWIVLVAAVVFAIAVGVLGPNMPGLSSALGTVAPAVGTDPSIAIFYGIFVLVIGLIYFLLLYAVGESFQLQVALEENTRLTAALLLRMHQESQIDDDNDFAAAEYADDPTF